MSRRIYVVCYDIADDARRHVIARMLEGQGMRVQESVFEVRQTRVGIVRLAEELKQRLRLGDSLRIYPLPTLLLPHCITVGGPPVPEANDFLLL